MKTWILAVFTLRTYITPGRHWAIYCNATVTHLTKYEGRSKSFGASVKTHSTISFVSRPYLHRINQMTNQQAQYKNGQSFRFFMPFLTTVSHCCSQKQIYCKTKMYSSQTLGKFKPKKIASVAKTRVQLNYFCGLFCYYDYFTDWAKT